MRIQSDQCSICYGTKKYINSRGRDSGDPCNVCDPEGYSEFVAKKEKYGQHN